MTARSSSGGHKPTQKQTRAVAHGKNAGGRETFVAVDPTTKKPLPRRQQPKTYGPGERPPKRQPKPKPTRKPSGGSSGGGNGGGSPVGPYQSQAGRYHSVIPGAPTHDLGYTPSQSDADHALQVLKNLQTSMPQDQFAQLMRTYGGTGDANGNGFLADQVSMGTGQMGFQMDYTVDPATGLPSGAPGGDRSGNVTIPPNPGSELGNHPGPNPGNFPGHPPVQYPGGGGVPTSPTGSGGFSQAPGRPGSGPSGITARSFLTRRTGATDPSAAQASGDSTDTTGQPTDQNAEAQLQQLLGQMGLSGLTGTVLDYLQQGYDVTSIQYLLTQTPEYKRRFAGNDARIKNGLGALSPAEYLATERAYQDVLRSAGMPAGFYDSPDDFTQWISGDVSPSELANRVDDAVKFAQSTDPTTRTALSAYFGIDTQHIAAYFLDPQRALPLLAKQANATTIGAAALNQGLGLTNLQDALRYTDQGVTGQQAQQGYSQIADMLPTEKTIAQRFGQTYDQTDAEQEVLGGLASATRKRRNLNQQEEALFSGSGGVGDSFYHPGFGLAAAAQGSF